MNSQLRDTNWDKGLSQSVSRRLSFGDTAVPQPTNHLFIGQQLQKSIINQVLSSEYKLQKIEEKLEKSFRNKSEISIIKTLLVPTIT